MAYSQEDTKTAQHLGVVNVTRPKLKGAKSNKHPRLAERISVRPMYWGHNKWESADLVPQTPRGEKNVCFQGCGSFGEGICAGTSNVRNS